MSAAIPENPYIQNLSSSYGPMIVGTAFSCALWGISCMQLFMYALHYENDPGLLKLFVYTIWFVETISEALTVAARKFLWPALIINWGSLAELGRNQLASLHRVWVVCSVTFAVEMYYFYRIYRFSGKRWLIPGLLLVPFVLWQLVMPVIFVVWCMEDLSYANLLTPRIKASFDLYFTLRL
ncbi:hypothetical protein K466DRAFT_606422 [Polyporus arcularius HHB13444]|uniref:Transmembrane protein n=1 Tax=Polyporus arcularius HHB13444 TaxID=1314778 RepID=A0A5C3NST2_9APHY|nr:hypothetical protein K466DRAFT_606422 [Polyporus arcularius HHB13444]